MSVEDEVRAHLATRRKILEKISNNPATQFSSEEIIDLWNRVPREDKDWGILLAFAEREGLPMEFYEIVHSLGIWLLDVALCHNPSVSENLLSRMAELKTDDAIPRMREDRLEEDYADSKIKYIARGALRKRLGICEHKKKLKLPEGIVKIGPNCKPGPSTARSS